MKGNSLKLEKKVDVPFLGTKKAGFSFLAAKKKEFLFFGCQKRIFSFLAAKKEKPSFLVGKNPFLGEKNCLVRPRINFYPQPLGKTAARPGWFPRLHKLLMLQRKVH